MFKIYTDGASKGNPGPSGAGGIIYDSSGTIIAKISENLNTQTNNVAEYLALKLTLERAIELNLKCVEVFMDSKLVVEQIQGRWKIKNEHLKEIHTQIQSLLFNFEQISFTHIYRHFNKIADNLANQGIST